MATHKKPNKFVRVNKSCKDGRNYFYRSKPKRCDNIWDKKWQVLRTVLSEMEMD